MNERPIWKHVLTDPMLWVVVAMYVIGLVNGFLLALRYA